MNTQNTSISLEESTNKYLNQDCTLYKKRKSGIDLIKEYLKTKTENRYKLHLSDQQAFKWKFNKKQSNRPLSSFKYLRKDSKNQYENQAKSVTYQDLKDFKFPVLKYKNKDLTQFAIQLLERNKYFQNEIKSKEILNKLITEISLNYNIVSYHNFSHAFSLSLILFQCFEYHKNLGQILSEKQKFYAFIAGLAHDMNHPGTNNAYQVKTKSKLAVEYSNISVLQNFHLRQFWKILQKNQDIDVFKKFQNTNDMKKMVTNLILTTDVSTHFKNLEKLKALKSQAQNKGQNILKNSQNKGFFMSQLFHACDISNPCVNFDNYITWAALLSYQFNQQTKLQKQNQVEITEMLKYKDLKTFYKGQLGFINFMVMPLWKQIVNVCKDLIIFTDNITQNIQILNDRIQNTKQQDEIIEINKL